MRRARPRRPCRRAPHHPSGRDRSGFRRRARSPPTTRRSRSIRRRRRACGPWPESSRSPSSAPRPLCDSPTHSLARRNFPPPEPLSRGDASGDPDDPVGGAADRARPAGDPGGHGPQRGGPPGRRSQGLDRQGRRLRPRGWHEPVRRLRLRQARLRLPGHPRPLLHGHHARNDGGSVGARAAARRCAQRLLPRRRFGLRRRAEARQGLRRQAEGDRRGAALEEGEADRPLRSGADRRRIADRRGRRKGHLPRLPRGAGIGQQPPGDQRRRARGLRQGRGLEGVAVLLAARGTQGAGGGRRSYALSTGTRGGIFNVYDDTRSQAYGGVGAETTKTDQAVSATRLQVVLYGGKVAQTFFFSTSGGHTENNEFSSLGFGQPAIPYLRGVDDPYEAEAGSPYEHWTRKYSIGRISGALHGIGLHGKLRNIVVTQRGASPRIVHANLVGSGGTTTVNGPQLASALGLPDTWAFFKRK